MIQMDKKVNEYLGIELPEKYKNMAENVARVLLARKVDESEMRRALRGMCSLAEALDPFVEIDYYGGSPASQFEYNRRQEVYRYWDLIGKVAQGKDKIQAEKVDIPYETLASLNEQQKKDMEQIIFLDHIAELEKIMEKDELDVGKHRAAWAQEKEQNPKLADYVERLGKMMQADMKFEHHPLTDMMFKRTCLYQDAFKEKDNPRQAIDLLLKYWKYGADLYPFFKDYLPEGYFEKMRQGVSEDKPQLVAHHRQSVLSENAHKKA